MKYGNHLASFDRRSGVLAVVGGTLRDGLGLIARGSALELFADGLDRSCACAGDSSGAAEVGVDTSEDLAVVGLGVCISCKY
jgi:hypothetical protein